MTNPPLPQPSDPACHKCQHQASHHYGANSRGFCMVTTCSCLTTELDIYRHALTEMQKELGAICGDLIKMRSCAEDAEAERDEALRYGRSADAVIADLRDQLAAFHLFPIDVAPFLTPEGNDNG